MLAFLSLNFRICIFWTSGNLRLRPQWPFPLSKCHTSTNPERSPDEFFGHMFGRVGFVVLRKLWSFTGPTCLKIGIKHPLSRSSSRRRIAFAYPIEIAFCWMLDSQPGSSRNTAFEKQETRMHTVQCKVVCNGNRDSKEIMFVVMLHTVHLFSWATSSCKHCSGFHMILCFMVRC